IDEQSLVSMADTALQFIGDCIVERADLRECHLMLMSHVACPLSGCRLRDYCLSGCRSADRSSLRERARGYPGAAEDNADTGRAMDLSMTPFLRLPCFAPRFPAFTVRSFSCLPSDRNEKQADSICDHSSTDRRFHPKRYLHRYRNDKRARARCSMI